MRDIRVINARVTLPIFSIAPIRGFYPPALLAVGTELSRTESVEVNDIVVDEFSSTAVDRLVVRIPDSQVGRPITSIRAYASASATQEDAVLEFALLRPVRAVSGIDRLVQQWLLIYMSTPGSDIFDKTSGGGGRSLIGKSTDRQADSVAADLALAINRTNSELIRKQAAYPNLPVAERLLSSTLENVSYDKSTSIIYARVALQNMAGQLAEVSLG
jgi:hypothetical protein